MAQGRKTTLGGAVPLLVVGLLFHATFLASIFDIYFVSPVVHVKNRFSALDVLSGEAPSTVQARKPLADRVVLIVGDGLRADKLFTTYPSPPFSSHNFSIPTISDTLEFPPPTLDGDETTAAPYIRSLIERGEASWGVSHTRVPTESRPGHVALIAGMYEDVSAVTRGWKLNPVNFDSVFNQSSHTYSFGSPDILPMFSHGASPPSKVDAFSYTPDFEDFTKDAAQLDIWVLDQLRALLANATAAGPTSILGTEIREGKVFFFLHLLGLDTTGHSYRPHSAAYYRNIAIVDQIVSATQNLIEEFYNHDGRTAYVFTADHGMSNIGNHGDGEGDNTRTPLVVWGSGVSKAGLEPGTRGWRKEGEDEDSYFDNWKLGRERKDVEQADIAALMAVLAGINVPGNSVGKLPVEYLDATPEEKARAGFATAREILEQYQVKHDLKASRAIRFTPFLKLPDAETLGFRTAQDRVFWITRLIASGRYEEGLKEAEELGNLALEGLRYDWFLLQTIVVMGYLGWMTYSTLFLLRSYSSHSFTLAPRDFGITFPSVIVWTCFLFLSTRFAIEGAPFTYYLYAGFPTYFWSVVIGDLAPFRAALSSLRSSGMKTTLLSMAAVLLGMESMVLGYFRRSAWTVGWLAIGLVWPMVGLPQRFKAENRNLVWMWSGATVLTAGFTVLPVEKGESLLVVTIGATCFLITGLLARKQGFRCPTKLQLALTALATLVTIDSGRKLQQQQGLPLLNQIIGWLILAASTMTARSSAQTKSSTWLTDRLLGIVFAFAPVFVILSISYETLFYFCFSGTLLVWLELESRLAVEETRIAEEEPEEEPEARVVTGADREAVPELIRIHQPLRAPHLRLAMLFLFFVEVAFFGTGNVASISSFYLEPVYRLVPVFNPFLMASLLVFKLLIPFLMVSAVFTALNRRLELPPFSLFITTLTISDILTLNFFFLVTDEGSWLEIGQSISHFTIASLLLVFLIGLHFVGEAILRRPPVKIE